MMNEGGSEQRTTVALMIATFLGGIVVVVIAVAAQSRGSVMDTVGALLLVMGVIALAIGVFVLNPLRVTRVLIDDLVRQRRRFAAWWARVGEGTKAPAPMVQKYDGPDRATLLHWLRLARSRIHRLQTANRQLKAENQRLRTRVIQLERDRASRPLTPSTTVLIEPSTPSPTDETTPVASPDYEKIVRNLRNENPHITGYQLVKHLLDRDDTNSLSNGQLARLAGIRKSSARTYRARIGKETTESD